jgi:hypothetical protein
VKESELSKITASTVFSPNPASPDLQNAFIVMSPSAEGTFFLVKPLESDSSGFSKLASLMVFFVSTTHLREEQDNKWSDHQRFDNGKKPALEITRVRKRRMSYGQCNVRNIPRTE